MPTRTSVLFVCLGNICRSPLAEGILIHKLNRLGVAERFRVDSAGTGDWHAGERPDRRSIEVAARRGVELPSRARQITVADLAAFDHIVCMDGSNRRDVLALGARAAKLSLMLDHHPAAPGPDVPDPYCGGIEDFEHVYELLDAACDGFLARRLSAAAARRPEGRA